MKQKIYRLCLDCSNPIKVPYVKRCPKCREFNIQRIRKKHNTIDREKIKECQRIIKLNMTDEDKVKRREYSREYYRKHSNYYTRINKSRKEIRHKIYLKRRENNLINPKRREYMKDPKNRITNRIRCRVWCALNRTKKNEKYYKFNEYIGCSPDYLMKYIESKFKPGMTMDNYGRNTWHIDHIIPCSSFNLSNADEQRRCFHYSNLQPLWANENYKKSNKII